MFSAIDRAVWVSNAVSIAPSYRKGWPNAYAVRGQAHPAHPQCTRTRQQVIALAVHVAVREHWGV